MGTPLDNENDDLIELQREAQPADLNRLQHDLELDRESQPDYMLPGGNNQQ
jgi:hypothetical protein